MDSQSKELQINEFLLLTEQDRLIWKVLNSFVECQNYCLSSILIFLLPCRYLRKFEKLEILPGPHENYN